MAEERPEDVVCGVCSDENGKELIDGIYVMSISPRPQAKMIGHPVESGYTTFDNKVLEPIRIDVHCYIKWAERQVIDTINEMWRNRTYQFYSVVARDGLYKRLALVSCPNTQTPRHFDTFDFTLHCQEVMFGSPVSGKPQNAANKSTVRSGRAGGSLGY